MKVALLLASLSYATQALTWQPSTDALKCELRDNWANGRPPNQLCDCEYFPNGTNPCATTTKDFPYASRTATTNNYTLVSGLGSPEQNRLVMKICGNKLDMDNCLSTTPANLVIRDTMSCSSLLCPNCPCSKTSTFGTGQGTFKYLNYSIFPNKWCRRCECDSAAGIKNHWTCANQGKAAVSKAQFDDYTCNAWRYNRCAWGMYSGGVSVTPDPPTGRRDCQWSYCQFFNIEDKGTNKGANTCVNRSVVTGNTVFSNTELSYVSGWGCDAHTGSNPSSFITPLFLSSFFGLQSGLFNLKDPPKYRIKACDDCTASNYIANALGGEGVYTADVGFRKGSWDCAKTQAVYDWFNYTVNWKFCKDNPECNSKPISGSKSGAKSSSRLQKLIESVKNCPVPSPITAGDACGVKYPARDDKVDACAALQSERDYFVCDCDNFKMLAGWVTEQRYKDYMQDYFESGATKSGYYGTTYKGQDISSKTLNLADTSFVHDYNYNFGKDVEYSYQAWNYLNQRYGCGYDALSRCKFDGRPDPVVSSSIQHNLMVVTVIAIVGFLFV